MGVEGANGVPDNLEVSVMRVARILGDEEAFYHILSRIVDRRLILWRSDCASPLVSLTAAVLAPHEIRNMMDEMFEAQMQWLPQFHGKTNAALAASIGRIQNHATRDMLTKGKRIKTKIGHYDAVREPGPGN